MLRVLHVIADVAPRYGGPSRAAHDMCRSLTARGHQVELFTRNRVLPVPIGVSIPTDGYSMTFFDFSRPPMEMTTPGPTVTTRTGPTR